VVPQDRDGKEGEVLGSAFGQAYAFSLGDAVVDCVEYVVPLAQVVEVAHAEGFRVRFCHNLSNVAAAALKVPELRTLATDMKVTGQHVRAMTRDEWEAVQFYLAVVFVKE
jgi:hypothetical protein